MKSATFASVPLGATFIDNSNGGKMIKMNRTHAMCHSTNQNYNNTQAQSEYDLDEEVQIEIGEIK